MAKRDKPLVRPLSPFMYYNKWPSMFLSILHRFTGIALTVGAVLLVYWLTAAAMGQQAYTNAQAVFACVWTQIALVGFIYSFSYHFLNGIRHLVWDTGRGLEVPTARKSGYAVFFGSFVVTAIIVALFFARVGGAA